MYTPYMSFSSDSGAITDQQNCVLILVFSEPVMGLDASQFQISGPQSAPPTVLKLLQGTSSYYHLLIVISASYTGEVNVAFSVSCLHCNRRACQNAIQDRAGWRAAIESLLQRT
jgi:hypothetical protein